MNRRIIGKALIVAAALGHCTSGAFAQLGGSPGAYARMGFGARGIGMGNAMSAVQSGEIVGFYNPALLPGAEFRDVSASFGVLSLDRKLNFLSFTQALPPDAGLSVGIINSGVTDIDGRDGDGRPTGPLSTSENQVFLGFGLRTKFHLSLGVNLKLLYYHLYTDMTSSTVGIDVGVSYPLTPALRVGATVRDIGSKYKWDSSPVLGQSGSTSEDDFPNLYTVGAAYQLPDSIGTVSAEMEASSASTLLARAGAEVVLIPALAVRAGVDRIDLKDKGNGVKPTAGFSLRTSVGDLTPVLNYAFVLEPFSPSGIHLISLSLIF